MTIDAYEISQAIAEADDAFRLDHRVVFGTDAERSKAFYAARKGRFNAWDRSGPCLFRGCTKPSISRSHTVQRSKVLARIAEKGHVLSPQVDDNGEVVLTRIGIKQASTFPGFCEEHENLFAEFEMTGLITDARHLGLQMMRTVCREIFRVRLGIAQLESALAEYQSARESYFGAAVRAAAADVDVKETRVEGDDIERLFIRQLEKENDSLSTITGSLFTEVMDYVEYGTPEPACTASLLPSDDPNRPPMELPLAMSGFAFIHYTHDEQTLTAPCTIAILPQDGSTLISFGTERQHSKLLPSLAAKLEVIFDMINMVESWMVFGTDHWFITPSVWDEIPAGRQTEICAGIASPDGSPGASIAPSILDDLRRFGLEALTPIIADGPIDQREAGEAFIERERAKLTTA